MSGGRHPRGISRPGTRRPLTRGCVRPRLRAVLANEIPAAPEDGLATASEQRTPGPGQFIRAGAVPAAPLAADSVAFAVGNSRDRGSQDGYRDRTLRLYADEVWGVGSAVWHVAPCSAVRRSGCRGRAGAGLCGQSTWWTEVRQREFQGNSRPAPVSDDLVPVLPAEATGCGYLRRRVR